MKNLPNILKEAKATRERLAEQSSPGDPMAGRWQFARMLGISSAPQDGKPILAWCKHAADKYFEGDGERLTPYGARAELSFCCDGFQVVRWSKAYFDDDCYVPAWWILDDEDGETAANPTHWMPLPETPVAGGEVNHPAQDMADPKNWQEGDVVECLVGTGFYYTAGRKYRLIKWSDKGNVVDSNGDVTMVDDEGGQWQARADKFRWISR